ncbi:nitroreductase family protein [Selenihalanaerobacter shriftii]|uniref:Nitroreductase n=1 Tax=Selenihalanaerobacter shriftii TaxID=142842 RepID=A0A1T4JK43_9FIRM|nr:nitroreductase family protein [Selenihalanaerobacter shriftii]SJZ30550.1 Nitroreductase [Selenihalanaerobacter shriftii]
MSELFDVVKNRRSIRNYKDEVPAKDKLEKIIEGANWAPSDGNSQPWKFYVAKGEVVDGICDEFYSYAKEHIPNASYIPEEKKQPMLEYAKDFGGAPVHIIVSYETEDDPIADEESLMAASAAVQNLMLTAADEDLGTVWIAGHVAHSDRVKNLLNLSESEEIAGIIPIGIPDMDPPVKERQDPKEKTEWFGF